MLSFMSRSALTRPRKAVLRLKLNGQIVANVFDLFGRNKIDILRAIGWTFSQCPEFLKHFVEWSLVFDDVSIGEVSISLQMWERADGFATLEILAGEAFHCLIQASPGSACPRAKQLREYASRLRRNGSAVKCLIVLTEVPRIESWASRPLRLSGVRLFFSSCKIFGALAMQAAVKTRRVNRRFWLEHLSQYIGAPISPTAPHTKKKSRVVPQR